MFQHEKCWDQINIRASSVTLTNCYMKNKSKLCLKRVKSSLLWAQRSQRPGERSTCDSKWVFDIPKTLMSMRSVLVLMLQNYEYHWERGGIDAKAITGQDWREGQVVCMMVAKKGQVFQGSVWRWVRGGESTMSHFKKAALLGSGRTHWYNRSWQNWVLPLQDRLSTGTSERQKLLDFLSLNSVRKVD